MAQILAFNRWPAEGIEVEDQGLKAYITLQPKIVPKTGGRYAGNKFYKSRIFIVERLINKLMIPGHKSKKHFKTSYHITGKSHRAYDIVENAFRMIEKQHRASLIDDIVSHPTNHIHRPISP